MGDHRTDPGILAGIETENVCDALGSVPPTHRKLLDSAEGVVSQGLALTFALGPALSPHWSP